MNALFRESVPDKERFYAELIDRFEIVQDKEKSNPIQKEAARTITELYRLMVNFLEFSNDCAVDVYTSFNSKVSYLYKKGLIKLTDFDLRPFSEDEKFSEEQWSRLSRLVSLISIHELQQKDNILHFPESDSKKRHSHIERRKAAGHVTTYAECPLGYDEEYQRIASRLKGTI